MKEGLLKSFWQKVFKTDLNFILISFILLGLIRVTGLVRGEIYLVVTGFIIMWFLPVIFLHKSGRKKIGIKKPGNWLWLFLAFLIGMIASGAIYWLGYLLYGTGIENWGMTVVSEYSAQEEVIIPVVFVVVTFLSMLFSPIGEELFFRGMIYEVLANRLSSYKWAGFLSSISFAVIHIPHHDIIFAGKGFLDVFIPIILWSILMFLVSYLFIFTRIKSGSILGAILCHSGFIMGMNMFVYFVLMT